MTKKKKVTATTDVLPLSDIKKCVNLKNFFFAKNEVNKKKKSKTLEINKNKNKQNFCI